jgi:hypothetical protein
MVSSSAGIQFAAADTFAGNVDEPSLDTSSEATALALYSNSWGQFTT